MDRKTFIQTTGRLGILAIIALVVGILLKNNQISAKPTTNKCQACKDRSTCKVDMANCTLPKEELSDSRTSNLPDGSGQAEPRT